jgi:WD40 repeat protein
METNPPNPFKGLRPYQEDDRLFGRDRDLVLMTDRIFSAPTTLLFAGSGVGKTSFLNAKVIPELKEQYCVIWHNRWTGADELGESKYEFADDKDMRFWPPRVLFRDLIRKLGFRGESETLTAKPQTHGSQSEDKLASEVHKTIAQNLRRSSDNAAFRLSQVLACFRKSSQDQKNQPSDKLEHNRCILILDQFEEVFQYHAYEDYFDSFVRDLCEIINNDDYQVRVVFSMREEFLGELSVFDNKIPDLFNNYYRLRHPDKTEAEDIIRRTCQLSGVDPDEMKLKSLVEDLSKIEKGKGSFAERATGQGSSKTQVIKRNFVAPPYLQIACERLWTQQYSRAAEKPEASSLAMVNGGSTEGKSFPPFLINYRAGKDDSDESEPGGEAQSALRSFCEEKLSPPFLSKNEQDLVARAFGFLVTKQGAKMAYELRSLAEHMDERAQPLKTVLEKLSQDDAKILRESRGPDRSYWFELYHDMYATIVDEWKIRYLKLKRWRDRRRLATVLLVGVPLLFLLILVPYVTYKSTPFKRTLLEFRDSMNGPAMEQQAGYSEAVNAFIGLKGTLGYSQVADSLWANILHRRAQWYESANDPSSALLCLLKAADMESDSQIRGRYLERAETLMGTNNGDLLATYCDDCASASLSSDGKKVLTRGLDRRVMLWTADPEASSFPELLCDNCNQAMFSADGAAVLTTKTVTSGDAREDESDDPSKPSARGATESGRRTNQLTTIKAQVWDTTTFPTTLKKSIDLKGDKSDTGNQTVDGSSSPPQAANVVVEPRQDTERKVNPAGQTAVRAFSRVGDAFWFAGVKSGQIYLWDGSGKGRALAPLISTTSPTQLVFSADGGYLLTIALFKPVKIWRVTKQDVTPYTASELDNGILAIFSPNGRLLLISGRDKIVRLIDLATKSTLVSLSPFSGPVRSLGFSPDGEQFYTRVGLGSAGEIQRWQTASGQPLLPTLPFKTSSTRTSLGPEGKTILRISGRGPRVFEKWDAQTGWLSAVLKREFRTSTFAPDGNSVLISERTARLWRFNTDTEGSRLVQGDIQPTALSRDGKVLLTVNDSSTLQFWDAEKGVPLGGSILPEANHADTLSGDGRYAAVAEERTIRVWQAGSPEAVATLPYAGNGSLVAFSADNKVLAAVDDSGLRLWNLVSGKETSLNEQHTATVLGIALAGDRMISGSDDKTARIWNSSDGRRMHVLQHDTAVTAVALSFDGKLALTGGDDGIVRLWDVEKGTRVGGEIGFEGEISGLLFGRDGRIVSALTASWMYLSTIDQNGLQYLKGSLIADPWQPLVAISDNGSRFRFVYELGHDGIQIQDQESDQSRRLKVFKDDPHVLLDEWQRKFSLRIGELGQIEKMWRLETPLDNDPESRQPKTLPH